MTRPTPQCGHQAGTWSLGDEYPLVCQRCHPRPGTSPPRPTPPPLDPYVTSRLSRSPWAHELTNEKSNR